MSKLTTISAAATAGTFLMAGASGAIAATPAGVHQAVTGSTAATTAPPGAPGHWRKVFDDEFSGKSLNRSKWNTGWFGNGVTQAVNSAEVACYDPANIRYSGKTARMMLTRHAETCGGKRQPVAGAQLNTMNKFEFTYGYVEARVWIAGVRGKIVNWPGIWLNGHTWPNDGEIDLFEGDQGAAAYHLHWGSGAAAHQMGSRAKGNFSAGYHTFGVDWEPHSITFYYDGRKASPTNTTSYGRNPAPGNLIPAVKHYVIIGNSSSASPRPVATASMYVDYVRIWQH